MVINETDQRKFLEYPCQEKQVSNELEFEHLRIIVINN